MPLYPCAVCGKPVEKPAAWRKCAHYVFCSDKCRLTPFIPKHCIVCGATFYVIGQAAGTAKFCSTDCRNTRNRVEQTHKKSPKITRTCVQCGRQFDVRKSVGKNALYCSKKCFHASGALVNIGPDNPKWKPKITVVCNYCGNEFETYPSRNNRRKYCCKAHRVLGVLQRLALNPRTDIERTMADALRKDQIAFAEQVIMYDKFMVDFKLNDYPIVIQCDGTYWHDRPRIKARDKGQDAYLTKTGYTVLRFNESQILNHIGACIATIKATIRNPAQPPLLNY